MGGEREPPFLIRFAAQAPRPRARGEKQFLRDVDAEEAAERAQGSTEGFEEFGRGGGQQGLGCGLAQEVVDLGAEAGGTVADPGYEPGPAFWDVERGFRAAFFAGVGDVRAGEAAGGEVGEQAGQALAGAGDARPDRQCVGAEDEDLLHDEGQQVEDEDGVQPFGEVQRGVWHGVLLGWMLFMFRSNAVQRAAQGKKARTFVAG